MNQQTEVKQLMKAIEAFDTAGDPTGELAKILARVVSLVHAQSKTIFDLKVRLERLELRK